MEMNLTGTENTTFVSSETRAESKSALGAVYLVVSLLVMSANSVVIFVIVKTRELHLPPLWTIIHMAVWDFLYGLYFLIFSVPSAFLNRFAYSYSLIGWASSIHTYIVGQNLFNTAMMVMDRFIAVKYPLRYPAISTKRFHIKVGLGSYLLNIGRLLAVILPGLEFRYVITTALCLSEFSTVGGRLASFTLIGSTFALIIVCSAIMFADIIKSRRRIVSFDGNERTSNGVAKFSLMAVLCAGVYCAAYLPACLSAGLYFIYGGEVGMGWLVSVSIVAILSNSLWNVFIYSATYVPFREGLLSTFCKVYYRQRRQAVVLATFQNRPRNELVVLHL